MPVPNAVPALSAPLGVVCYAYGGLIGVALLLTWRLKKRPPAQAAEAVES